MRCRICNADVSPLATAQVLGRYDVKYVSCGNCGFVQTETPYWLGEAYSDSIAKSDVGLVGRNIRAARIAVAVIRLFYKPDAKFLDYGGGTGLFVRLMRDFGFDFYWSDKYGRNEFAVGFEAKEHDGYELVTAFEVFEHLSDPLAAVDEILAKTGSILFSTQLMPRETPLPRDWWYYTLDTGQHISLYSRLSLQTLATRLGTNLYTNGVSMHLLTKRRLSEAAFFLVTVPPVSRIAVPLLLVGRRSLLDEDYHRLTGKRLR